MLGIPVSATIDEFLLFEDKAGFWDFEPKYELVYSRHAVDGALWCPLLEKAAAKMYGNFEML